MKHRLLITAAAVLLLTLPAQAQLFGPSDEEVAAQKAHEDSQDFRIQQNAQGLEQADTQMQQMQTQFQAQLRDLGDRVRSLTDSLARATGANEELTHQIGLLNARIEQQQKDFNYRLCTISAQQLGADAGSLNCAATGTGAGPAPQAQTPPGAALAPLGSDNNQQRGRAPGVLGTLPSGPNPRLTSDDGGGGGALSSGDGRQFDSAMNLLSRGQYPEAGAAFRAYADSHPDDDKLSPQALYWVGDIAYTQQDYAAASRTFAEAIKKYPKSPRAAESMLKLGQSLVAQGQASSGCTAFRAVTRKQYPDASPSTLDAVAAARKTANCR
jgi:tol-pal system protein YbgF